MTNHSTYFQQSAYQRKVDAAIERARAEVQAAVGAVAIIETAPVTLGVAPVDKSRQSKSLTSRGAIISSPSYEQKLRDLQAERTAKANQKTENLAAKVTHHSMKHKIVCLC